MNKYGDLKNLLNNIGNKKEVYEIVPIKEKKELDLKKVKKESNLVLKALGDEGKSVGKISLEGLKISAYTLTSSIFIPTSIRRTGSKGKIISEYMNDFGAFFGLVIGGTTLICSFVFGINNWNISTLITGSSLLATNTLSGAYELIRHHYKKNKKALEDNLKENNLKK